MGADGNAVFLSKQSHHLLATVLLNLLTLLLITFTKIPQIRDIIELTAIPLEKKEFSKGCLSD